MTLETAHISIESSVLMHLGDYEQPLRPEPSKMSFIKLQQSELGKHRLNCSRKHSKAFNSIGNDISL
jgi:hypothetical protein